MMLGLKNLKTLVYEGISSNKYSQYLYRIFLQKQCAAAYKSYIFE